MKKLIAIAAILAVPCRAWTTTAMAKYGTD